MKIEIESTPQESHRLYLTQLIAEGTLPDGRSFTASMAGARLIMEITETSDHDNARRIVHEIDFAQLCEQWIQAVTAPPKTEPWCNHDEPAVDADGWCECGAKIIYRGKSGLAYTEADLAAKID